MKVLLAGGYGTRLSEETELKPNSIVKICAKQLIVEKKRIDYYE